MFLSFIVPVYNALPYLEECLQSLLAQDLPDYEIVCVDDGSVDGSSAVIDAYAAEHSKIIPIHQKNSGVAAARNAGLSAARGDYIWFVDADDFIAPNILSRLLAEISATGSDQLMIGGFQFENALTAQQEALRSAGRLPDNVPGPGAVVWRSLLRRAFLSEHGITFRHLELTHGEDGQFLFELSRCSPVCAEVRDTVYFYRVRSGSAETSVSRENQQKKLRSHVAVARIMQDYYLAGNQDCATVNRLMQTLWYCLYDAAKLPFSQARQVLSQLAAIGLFPFRTPENCTLTCSYMFHRDSLSGRCLDRVYLRLHTRAGFWGMWCLVHCYLLLRQS